MTCRNCKFDFCWICEKDWQKHGERGYECNRYNEAAEGRQSESRSALQRYLFYYDRYMNHLNSLNLQDKLKEKVTVNIEFMQKEVNMSWIEAQFLKKALSALGECRRVLMHTYIFAFYLKKNNHVHIFEDNQRDLEVAVEHLCAILEREELSSKEKDVEELKQDIQDKTRYCMGRKQTLLEHVEEGHEKGDRWVFNQPDCE